MSKAKKRPTTPLVSLPTPLSPLQTEAAAIVLLNTDFPGVLRDFSSEGKVKEAKQKISTFELVADSEVPVTSEYMQALRTYRDDDPILRSNTAYARKQKTKINQILAESKIDNTFYTDPAMSSKIRSAYPNIAKFAKSQATTAPPPPSIPKPPPIPATAEEIAALEADVQLYVANHEPAPKDPDAASYTEDITQKMLSEGYPDATIDAVTKLLVDEKGNVAAIKEFLARPPKPVTGPVLSPLPAAAVITPAPPALTTVATTPPGKERRKYMDRILALDNTATQALLDTLSNNELKTKLAALEASAATSPSAAPLVAPSSPMPPSPMVPTSPGLGTSTSPVISPSTSPSPASPSASPGLGPTSTVSASTDASTGSTLTPPPPPQLVGKGTADKDVYIPRYHETSLKLYFQNSSYPAWDHVLESNILSLDISKAEITEMMDAVIREYGPRVFVMKRKGDSLEELNELVQLQFCVMRNLHLGDRSRTAQVKLSDLANLQKAAAGQMGAAPGAGATASPLVNFGANETIQPLNLVSTGDPLVQTKAEAQFIKDYDRLLTLTNLSRAPGYTKQVFAPQVKVTSGSAQSLGIRPGNNPQSAANDKATQTNRIIRPMKLIRG